MRHIRRKSVDFCSRIHQIITQSDRNVDWGVQGARRAVEPSLRVELLFFFVFVEPWIRHGINRFGARAILLYTKPCVLVIAGS